MAFHKSAVQLVGALQHVEKAVGRLDLEQERKRAGQRIQIGQQDLFGAQPLPLKRQIAGDGGGSAGAFGGHHRVDFRGLLAARPPRWAASAPAWLEPPRLIAGEGLDQEVDGSGAQAAQDQIRIVARPAARSPERGPQAGHLGQQVAAPARGRRQHPEKPDAEFRLPWLRPSRGAKDSCADG